MVKWDNFGAIFETIWKKFRQNFIKTLHKLWEELNNFRKILRNLEGIKFWKYFGGKSLGNKRLIL